MEKLLGLGMEGQQREFEGKGEGGRLPGMEAADCWAEGLWKRVPDESDSPDLSCGSVFPRSEKRPNKAASPDSRCSIFRGV